MQADSAHSPVTRLLLKNALAFTAAVVALVLSRNHLIVCLLKMSQDNLRTLPKVIGIDVVEMALWAKVSSFLVAIQNLQPCTSNLHLNVIYAKTVRLKQTAYGGQPAGA